MRLVVYLPLVVPLLAAVVARPLAERLPPAVATWLLSVSALLLAAGSSAVLGMLALTAVVRLPLVDVLGEMSGQVIRSNDPASVPVAVVAGALLVLAVVSTVRALWKRVSALLAAGRKARLLPGTGQVVVTGDDAADAYTLPGLPCRVVVTDGMLRALDDPEQRVLLAHEGAHAAGMHYLFGTVAKVAAAANPFLGPVTSAVGYTMERWADERAAAVTGDRQLTARAVARAALATTANPPRRPAAHGVLGILGAVTRLSRTRRPGPVPRRVAALLRPPPELSLVLLAIGVLLVAVSGASVVDAAGDLHAILDLARLEASS